MRTVGQVAVLALYLLMLIVAGLLILIAPILVFVGVTDPAEMGGAAGIGVVFLILGALLAWASVLLLRGQWRRIRHAPDTRPIVEEWGATSEGRDLWGGSE